MTTAYKIKPVSDRVERAKALLLSQFKESPNINLFIEALVEELQEFENTVTDLQSVRTLNGSYGWWLDRIGEELKVGRGNYNDDDYKTAIKIAMAKKTSSATEQDILRLVYLLTSDTEAVINNDYPYYMELVSYLFCVSDSKEGLIALADLFPVNTRIRLVKQHGQSFKFGTAGRGFSSGSTLNDLVFHRYGNTDDARFTTVPEAIIPPPILSIPFNLVNPTLSGIGEQDQLLSVSSGEWAGTTPISLSYKWLRDGVDIVGETTTSYTITSSDLGTSITCVETATNTVGSTSAVTNAIIVSEDVPVVQAISAGLGISRAYKFTEWNNNGPVTATASIEFKNDGTVDRVAVIPSLSQWLTVTGVGAGADYSLSYQVISGNAFTNLNPDVAHDMTDDITFAISVTANSSAVNTGQYAFTVRSKIDPSVSETNTITITAEIVDVLS
jgi:hypothetical protein